ncbi:MAG TPA: methylated-DNA--[protein]-cysteine S-methyltransferase [Bryobacteraceae bacterium]|nr:methylated-DNA--[protein]-cysteine S-methyltransferase [Bryobacteraceae bacterium]
MILHYDEFRSPIGRILYVSDEDAVCALYFADYEDRLQASLARRFGNFTLRRGSDPLNLKQRLGDYFKGDLHAFDRIQASTGGTPFQERVWTALREIPPGKTWSYGQLAARLDRPQAARAVGHANSLNPVSIILPCHRVIGASSALVGYGGGLERKQWLLRHEGALPLSLDLQDRRHSITATA